MSPEGLDERLRSLMILVNRLAGAVARLNLDMYAAQQDQPGLAPFDFNATFRAVSDEITEIREALDGLERA